MKKLIFISLVSLTLLLSGCKEAPKEETTKEPVKYEKKDKTLNIIATNSIVENIIKYITGDIDDIESMFSLEIPKSEKEFTEDTYGNISTKDIYFYLGSVYENYDEKISSNISYKNTSMIDLSKGIAPLDLNDNSEYSKNPYYFYSVKNLGAILNNIKVALENINKNSIKRYNNGFDDALSTLDEIKKIIDKGKSSYKDCLFITSTPKVSYLLSKDLGVSSTYINRDSITEKDYEEFLETLNDSKELGKDIIWICEDDLEIEPYTEQIGSYGINIHRFSISDDDIINGIKSFVENLNKNIAELKDSTV